MPVLPSGVQWRASLPMYKLPEMRRANPAVWHAIRLVKSKTMARGCP
jgi:hypothetical protein